MIEEIRLKLQYISTEGERILQDIGNLSSEDLREELPAVLLRLRYLERITAGYCRKLEELTQKASRGTPEEIALQQLEGMASMELSWITDTIESLEQNREGLKLSEEMARTSFRERLRASLKGGIKR